ncbi:MAG: LarC family nickel insertion protein, partial [Nitrospirota bacterium]|nr:LarC family nickel insertion protein [Nitrospirota bacterium]
MIAYFDCFSGISGDMILGALVDAGVSVSRLASELSHLPVKGYRLESKKVERAGFA